VTLNDQGIRDSGRIPTEGRWRVAFLGDSVTFGQSLDENEVFTEVLQQRLEREAPGRAKVLNWGVPGYDVEDLRAQLLLKNACYRANEILYLLNLNDFARTGTVYEGADNGLHRMYRMPVLKSPILLKKLFYRLQKGGRLVSPAWYRWLVGGNEAWAYALISQMAKDASQQHASFGVFLLPAGCAYSQSGYELADLHARIAEELRQRGVTVVDLAPLLTKGLFDPTDHLTPAGHRALSQILAPRLVQAKSNSRRRPLALACVAGGFPNDVFGPRAHPQ
jgi:lysophospholipase L1-like esterase